MLVCQVKFGSVVHNVKDDLYARVIGLVDVAGQIRIQIHLKSRPEDPEPKWDSPPVPFVYWELCDCEPLTERERDGSLFIGIPEGNTDSLDREV